MKQIIISIVISALLIVFSLLYSLGIDNSVDEKAVESYDDVYFKIPWGQTGLKLVESGAIDIDEMIRAHSNERQYVEDILNESNKEISVTPENARVVLNTLWAFGLANKNDVLDYGPMINPAYGGAGRFASTGGWTLSKGSPMDHYSAHNFVKLDINQQATLEEISKRIFRPCCDNSTYFPDCNHGIAMLGLLEILVANDFSESDIYEIALKANSLWFGEDMYKSIAMYLINYEGLDDSEITPKILLSKKVSSLSGYNEVKSKVEINSSASSCSV